jgi:hypothetical protein
MPVAALKDRHPIHADRKPTFFAVDFVQYVEFNYRLADWTMTSCHDVILIEGIDERRSSKRNARAKLSPAATGDGGKQLEGERGIGPRGIHREAARPSREPAAVTVMQHP